MVTKLIKQDSPVCRLTSSQPSLTWLLMEERRCDVISMVEASDCRGGVAVSICSLEAVAWKKWWVRPRLCIKLNSAKIVHDCFFLTSACVVRDMWRGLAGAPWGGWGRSAVVKSLQSLFEARRIQLWLWARVLTLQKGKKRTEKEIHINMNVNGRLARPVNKKLDNNTHTGRVMSFSTLMSLRLAWHSQTYSQFKTENSSGVFV